MASDAAGVETVKKGDKRIDARLARFAVLCNQGVKPTDAMRQSGFEESTVHKGATLWVEKARALGLLVNPAVIQDAVAVIEQALPDFAAEIVRVGLGGRPKHQAQLEWLKEGFDRTRGKPAARHELTGAGGGPLLVSVPITEIVVERPAPKDGDG